MKSKLRLSVYQETYYLAALSLLSIITRNIITFVNKSKIEYLIMTMKVKVQARFLLVLVGILLAGLAFESMDGYVAHGVKMRARLSLKMRMESDEEEGIDVESGEEGVDMDSDEEGDE